MKKVFLHHDGALGDVLLSLPCILAIKADCGLSHIAGRHDVVRLLKGTGVTDDSSSSDSSIYASLYGPDTGEKASSFLSQFDHAFVFTTRGDSILASSIERIIPMTKTILTIPPKGTIEHVSDFRLKQLIPGGKTVTNSPLLEIPPRHRQSAMEFLSARGFPSDGMHLIALHPGSGSTSKCWPLEKYLALAERTLSRIHSKVLIFSGPAESRRVRERIDDFALTNKNVLHVHDEDLALVAALLSMCRVYVGNDSGISHMASAMNGNVIVLFGPTDPRIWRPLGSRVRVISSGVTGSSLPGITVDEVYAAVTDSLL